MTLARAAYAVASQVGIVIYGGSGLADVFPGLTSNDLSGGRKAQAKLGSQPSHADSAGGVDASNLADLVFGCFRQAAPFAASEDVVGELVPYIGGTRAPVEVVRTIVRWVSVLVKAF